MSAPLARLAALGGVYSDPAAAIDWRDADPTRPWLPPDLLSLAALGPRADDAALVLRFSRIEFARLCAAGLWLEGIFISQLTRKGTLATAPEDARLMLREVREEAGHGLMFLEAIARAGLRGVDLLGPTRLLTWIALRLDPARAPFWAMTFIGEAVTDAFATRALKQGEAICPVARRILWLHHRDEARHIAAARGFVAAKQGGMGALGRRAFPPIMHALVRIFVDAALYPTPQSLAALGLPDPAGAARAARACPRRRAIVRACVQPALESLARAGMIPAPA